MPCTDHNRRDAFQVRHTENHPAVHPNSRRVRQTSPCSAQVEAARLGQLVMRQLRRSSLGQSSWDQFFLDQSGWEMVSTPSSTLFERTAAPDAGAPERFPDANR